MNWQKELDKQQWEAVSHPGGPVIVLAGAGSGKTRVLTYRVAYLLAQGIPPHSILALTFTNKAADTMRQRVEALIGPAALGVRMGTFHSIFARWLRRELRGTPVSPDFTIYDEDDVRALLKQVLTELHYDPKHLASVRSLISRWKNEGKTWREVQPSNPFEQIAQTVFQQYEVRLRAANAMDFDDLLLETQRLFVREPAVLARYHSEIQHILVDEYQDTNPLQYHILKLLAQPHRNIFVVGDDAQSIYRFRGADVRNFRFLERDFAPVRIIRLEQNYRSTPQILRIANIIIQNSTELYPKELFTKNPPGPAPVVYKGCLNVREEAQYVAMKIREEIARYHLQYRDFAVLYRINAYSRTFEEELRAARIPYRLVGTLSFYQREEVKHFLAFLRFLVNPHDEQALLRIMEVRGEGIGEATKQRLFEIGQGRSLWEVLPEAPLLLKSSAAQAVRGFYAYLEHFREKLLSLSLAEQVATALEMSGLLKYYEGDERAKERIENLQELVNAAREFAASAEGEPSLREFLERVALASSTDDPRGGPPNAVWLSTVHGVKGLEFHTVFLVGVVEGLFPHAYANEEGSDALEEERRIFYVALTRAARHLYILQPKFEMRGANVRPSIPSRFLSEIEEAEKEKSAVRPARLSKMRRVSPSTPPKAFAFPPEEASPPSEIKPGCRVQHTHFGYGKVLSREENGLAGIVEVHFDDHGTKKLDLRYAKLRVVP